MSNQQSQSIVGKSGFGSNSDDDQPIIPTSPATPASSGQDVGGDGKTDEVIVVPGPGMRYPEKSTKSKNHNIPGGDRHFVDEDDEDDESELIEAARRAASRTRTDASKDDAASQSPDQANQGDDGGRRDGGNDQTHQTPAPKTGGTTESNLANLRKKLEFVQQENEQFRKRIDELTPLAEKSEQFKAWEEEKKKLLDELENARPYRDLYALHENPTFKETYVIPMDEIKSSITKLATDYGTAEDEASMLVEKLLSATSARERNDILSDLFGSDDVAISEARASLQKYEKIKKDRNEAEKTPADTLQKIRSAQKEAEVLRAQEIVQRAAISSKAGWNNALEINAGEKFGVGFLREIPGNQDHNNRRAMILKNAEALHQQIVDMALKKGARVDVQLASFLAGLAQMCEVSSVALAETEHYKKQAYQFAEALDRLNGMARPGARTAPPSSATPAPVVTSKNVAKTIFDAVVNGNDDEAG